MTDLLAPKKKKAKVEPPSTSVVAFRAYARTSYYLATVGDFNHDADDEARKLLDEHFGSGMPDTSDGIGRLRADRLISAGMKNIPAGDHIDGLAIRTADREKVRGIQTEKQTAVKTPKAEKLAVTPNMARLLKKKGKKSMDEAGETLA
jgi:hypothetical protein